MGQPGADGSNLVPLPGVFNPVPQVDPRMGQVDGGNLVPFPGVFEPPPRMTSPLQAILAAQARLRPLFGGSSDFATGQRFSSFFPGAAAGSIFDLPDRGRGVVGPRPLDNRLASAFAGLLPTFDAQRGFAHGQRTTPREGFVPGSDPENLFNILSTAQSLLAPLLSGGAEQDRIEGSRLRAGVGAGEDNARLLLALARLAGPQDSDFVSALLSSNPNVSARVRA